MVLTDLRSACSNANKTAHWCGIFDMICSDLILFLGSFLQACELSALFALSQSCRLSLAAQRGESLWQLLGMRDFRHIVHMLTRRNSALTVVSRPLILITAKEKFNFKPNQKQKLPWAMKVDREPTKRYWLKRYKQFRSRMLFECMEPTLFADSDSEGDSETQTDAKSSLLAWQRQSWVRLFQYLLQVSACEISHYCKLYISRQIILQRWNIDHTVYTSRGLDKQSLIPIQHE